MLLLVVGLARSEYIAVVASDCQKKLLAEYFAVVLPPTNVPSEAHLESKRADLAVSIGNCPLPNSGVEISWWGRVTDLETAIVSGAPDVLKAAIARASATDMSEWRKSGRGTTRHPAFIAATFGDAASLDLLASHGIEINIEDEFGNTPLHVAAGRENSAVDLVLLLIRLGADVNHRGDTGITPLHEPVVRGSLDVVQLLLDHGAKICAGGPGDTTIIDELSRLRSTALTVLLQAHALSSKSGCGLAPE